MPDRLDLSLIEAGLIKDAMESVGAMPWLDESYTAPRLFWGALFDVHKAFFPWSGKTSLFGRYDFFQDIVVRNRSNSSPAFRWVSSSHGWRALSYAELGELASMKAAGWAAAGARSGRKICIVSPFNERYVIALLAALKMGLIVSCLPPQGGAFLEKRLKALAPDHIAVEGIYLPMLQNWKSLILPERPGEDVKKDEVPSYSYKTGEAVALLFDPSSETPHIPRRVPSDAAYLCSVRDGLIALGIRPGLALAAPGFHFLETQPALLLSCLMNGGTFVHLTENDIAETPLLLTGQTLRAVGVTTGVRDVLLRNPSPVGKAWDYWFREPAESQDLVSWKEFIDVLNLKDAYACNQRWSAALGGCLLFSLRRKGMAHTQVLPSAGITWQTADLADTGRESLWPCGYYAPSLMGAEKDETTVCGGVIARNRSEWMFVRPVMEGRSGRVYPVGEVLEVLAGLAPPPSCSVVEIPPAGGALGPLFVLLVFVGGRSVDESVLASNIRKRIERELGKEFLPDRVEVLPLHPRRDEEGGIDHVWCRDNYLMGGLARRSRGDVYRCITELRDMVRPA